MTHRCVPSHCLKEGFSVSVSERALITRFPMVGSLAQYGIKPECMSLQRLPFSSQIMTGTFCSPAAGISSGPMLNRAVQGRSRSSFHRTLISPKSNVAVMRPRMNPGTYSAVMVKGQGRLSIQSLHSLRPCSFAASLLLKILRAEHLWFANFSHVMLSIGKSSHFFSGSFPR
jgi:hypothetical protein